MRVPEIGTALYVHLLQYEIQLHAYLQANFSSAIQMMIMVMTTVINMMTTTMIMIGFLTSMIMMVVHNDNYMYDDGGGNNCRTNNCLTCTMTNGT